MKIIKNSVLTIALLLGACEQAELLPLDSTQNKETQYNGFQLNGSQDNGFQLNGLQVNGFQLNGFQLNGFQLNGFQLNGLQVGGSQLTAYKNSDPSQVLSGTGMVGSVANITIGTGKNAYQVLFRIDAIYADPTSTATDVYLYDASYQVVGQSTWTSVCKDSAGNAAPGIPIANYWNMTTGARVDDANTITFACVTAAIGKCVRWGYRPWATGTRCSGGTCTTVSLKDYHQACTRMVRADYCGNGTPNTVNGTPIDVYDGLSPQIQSPASTWPVEAKWTPNGATCLGNTRGADLIKKFKYPDCNNNRKNDDFPACVENDYSVIGANLLGDNYNSSN